MYSRMVRGTRIILGILYFPPLLLSSLITSSKKRKIHHTKIRQSYKSPNSPFLPLRHTYNLHKKSDISRPRLDGVCFRSLLLEEKFSLTTHFLLVEIEGMMSYCDGNKSLGPNEFNFYLLKRLWTLLREDLGIMFDNFHRFSVLPHNLASIFLTRTPKVKNPSTLGIFG